MKWNELLRNTPKVTPNYNFGATNKVFNLDVKYQAGIKAITFYGSIRSAHSSEVYHMQVSFSRIDTTEGLTDNEILEGYLPKPSLAKHDIQVRCDCASYRFRFDEANHENRASLGKFGIYHRKTNRKPNNPRNLPGICYHLIEFVDYLQSQGFIH